MEPRWGSYLGRRLNLRHPTRPVGDVVARVSEIAMPSQSPALRSKEATAMKDNRIPPLTSPRRRRLLLEAATVAAVGVAPAWVRAAPAGAGKPPAVPRPPVARIEPVSETFFGETVVDPYRWMENPKDKDLEPFMRGQDAHARAVLAAIPGRDQLARRIGELSSGTTVAFGV
jgi:hypothetical protein